MMRRNLVLAFVLLCAAPLGAETGKTPTPIYTQHGARAMARPAARAIHARPLVSSPRTTANGQSCSVITFEGLSDLGSIPAFDGISLPDWLAILEQADGGSGNFSGEPSPSTIAFWLSDNNTETIPIPNGASSISFYYSSYYPITVSIYDANNTLLNTTTGAANFDATNNSYDVWSLLQIAVPSSNATPNAIATMTITGGANYTGLDNLSVCQTPSIHSVEFTQAIQQWQTLADLKTSLTSNQEPPVPMITGKPAALRVYFNTVQQTTPVTVTLSGVASQSLSASLAPNCVPDDERARANGCASVDFYFTPPTGKWTATLNVVDPSGNTIEEEAFPIASRDTNSLLLRAVSVCDTTDTNSNWLCGDASALPSLAALLSKVIPTASVNVAVAGDVVENDYTAYTDPSLWWGDTMLAVASLYENWNYTQDAQSGQYTVYMGAVRPAPTDGSADPLEGVGGMADDVGSIAALARTSVPRFNDNAETNEEVVAHETGHTLGLRHTNTQAPYTVSAPPGCYNFAADTNTDWSFANNEIQSTTRPEVGYDVAAHAALDPSSTFEMMSYCSPRWISPERYKTMIATLGGGTVSTPSARAAKTLGKHALASPSAAGTTAAFWTVSGSIANNTVSFAPLLQLTLWNSTATGSGSYSLQEQGSGGTVLFQRNFTPNTPATETSGTDLSGALLFTQIVPVTANTSAIVLKNASGTELGRITLQGTAPTVSISAPTQTSGTQSVSWTIQGTASTYTSTLLYSADNGATWRQIANGIAASTTPVNFDKLAGGAQSLLRVIASDGVNSGSGTTAIFTVSKKSPYAPVILTPTANFAQPAAQPLLFTGTGYDPEDGALSGTALQWSSNLQGALGTGSPLSATLKAGKHTITLTATDADGNSTTATTTLVLGGAPPVVNPQITAVSAAPTSCLWATLTATPGTNGASLTSAQYSLDGGSTYTSVPVASLPYGFVIPGTGFVQLVERAVDASGQISTQDVTFMSSASCALTTQTLTFPALGDQVFGVAPLSLNATSDSGLAVSYAVTGPASVSNGLLTITGSGTITVTAEQSGDATYAPASWVSQTIAVTPDTPVIQWSQPSAITYGTPLGSVLNAIAMNGTTGVGGSFAYTAATNGGSAITVTSSTVLAAGSYTLSAAFTPTDTADYNSATGSVLLTVAQAAPTITVGTTAANIFAQNSTTFTAAVTSPSGNPTGSVTFYDGTTQLGSATLANGTVSYATTTLSAGAHSITAVYAGDSNFLTETSTALTETVVDFTLTASTSTQSIKAGASAAFALTLAPTTGNTTPAAITLTATGLPTGATPTFSPTSIVSGSGSTNITLTIQTTSASLSRPARFAPTAALPLLCLVLLPFTRIMRRSWMRLLLLLAVLAPIVWIASCGGGSVSSGGNGGGSSTNYSITVSAVSGPLSHTTTLTLTVQ